jgi:tetratricopeptide (TPR) repeat protein
VSPFRRKSRDQPPPPDDGSASDRPPRADEGSAPDFDEIVSPFFAADDWAGLIGALDRIDPQELDEPHAIRWHTGMGIAAERLGRRDDAVSAYTEGVRRHPDSSVLRTVAGRVLEEEGRFDEALPHFRRVRLDDGGGEAVMVAARYCYLWNAFEDAIALHAQIFDAYFSLGIVDDTFLHIRGLPFFSRAYGAQAAVLVLNGSADGARELFERSEAQLSDFQGTEDELLTLDATLGQPTGLLGHLSGEAQGGGGRSGYAQMQLATWRARGSDRPAEAEELLASATVRENDFSWLEDIRLLALIAAARKGGELQQEDPRIAELFERQKRLFEPEHAFHFGLLDEQEILKERYRDLRRQSGPPSWS